MSTLRKETFEPNETVQDIFQNDILLCHSFCLVEQSTGYIFGIFLYQTTQ